MGNLQSRNPQAYSQINSAMQGGANPQSFLQQMMKNNNITPEQMQNVLNQASNLGVPKEVLQQVQNIK